MDRNSNVSKHLPRQAGGNSSEDAVSFFIEGFHHLQIRKPRKFRTSFPCYTTSSIGTSCRQKSKKSSNTTTIYQSSFCTSLLLLQKNGSFVICSPSSYKELERVFLSISIIREKGNRRISELNLGASISGFCNPGDYEAPSPFVFAGGPKARNNKNFNPASVHIDFFRNRLLESGTLETQLLLEEAVSSLGPFEKRMPNSLIGRRVSSLKSRKPWKSTSTEIQREKTGHVVDDRSMENVCICAFINNIAPLTRFSHSSDGLAVSGGRIASGLPLSQVRTLCLLGQPVGRGCGHCGKYLTSSFSTGKRKKYGYYRCFSKDCGQIEIRKEKLESSFLD
ncbi:MAG: hypothetical protein GX465_18795, partial [Acidobacteria bacterium]|nr:hypothetical protein [Acidobacteriota bacterium]